MREEKSLSSTEAAAADAAAQYLTFQVEGEVFAMDIRLVREIIQFNSMTPVPLMPDFVRGVINLRGAVVPVIDIRARFEWGRSAVGKKSCVIIFDSKRDGERVELGVLVDAVSEVLEISDSQIEAAPQFGTVIKREFIKGVGKVDGEFVAILDADQALHVEEMASLAEQQRQI